jgi:predicted transposase YdaD
MKKESRQEGILEGERINLNKNIKTMNSNGADEKTIAKLLGLDIEFVKKVLNA